MTKNNPGTSREPLGRKNGSRKREGGYSLVELITVVAILAVLASIIVPQFGDLLKTSKESSLRGNLSLMRNAIRMYFSDTEGFLPLNLETALTQDADYLKTIPVVTIPAINSQSNPGHAEISGIRQGDGSTFDDASLDQVWYYDEVGGTLQDVYVNCTHKDSKGTVWSTR